MTISFVSNTPNIQNYSIFDSRETRRRGNINYRIVYWLEN